jgi:propanol-preferring alcohol dehydrogenase
MRAMLLRTIGSLRDNPEPLELVEWPDPVPTEEEVLIRVSVCCVCHTELDEIEGRTPPAYLPIILGHQVVGRVEALGKNVENFKVGDRVGVAWIFSACGYCEYCRKGDENLCDKFRATGRDANGGYAELMVVPAGFAHAIPDVFTDAEVSPLLCAGAVGYRALRLTRWEEGQNLGLTGFGSSARLVLELIKHQYADPHAYIFARSESERADAIKMGACWAGDTSESPPEKMHAIIDTTPAWTPVVKSLQNLRRGGRLVINAISKEETDKKALLDLDYPSDLWLEKEIKSVANVTRFDVREFLKLAAEIPIRADVQEYALEDANHALVDIKTKSIHGAKVLRISHDE